MKIKNVFYLPSGRVFLFDLNGFLIESTEMRDVSVSGKENEEVRETLDSHIVWKHLKPYEEKWLLTVSTQKGCTHKCEFCDVAGLGFHGNLSQHEIEDQIIKLLEYTPYVKKSKKVKIGFARMGEPSHNLKNVLNSMRNLKYISQVLDRNFEWLPCFNSILPRQTISGLSGFDVINEIVDLKNNYFNGNLHFQISCNSTDEIQRKELFGGADVLTLKEIISHINSIPNYGRTVTLNFIVMKGIEISVDKLLSFGMNKETFKVKLIPLNNTIRAQSKRLKTFANYENFEELKTLGEKFNAAGIETVVDAIAKCEEAGLCCGQLAQIFQ